MKKLTITSIGYIIIGWNGLFAQYNSSIESYLPENISLAYPGISPDYKKSKAIYFDRLNLNYIDSIDYSKIVALSVGAIPPQTLDSIIQRMPSSPEIEYLCIESVYGFDTKNLKKFTNLKWLSIWDCELKKIPNSIKYLAKIEFLSFGQGIGHHQSGNKIKNVPKFLTKLSNLEYIILIHNRIKNAANLFKIPSLKMLDLSQNEVSGILIPETSSSLQFCYLAHNKISSCTGLGNLENLEYLSLNQNELTQLDSSFCSLKKLNTLILSNNNIQTIPICISSIVSLNKIEISNLPLSEDEINKLSERFELKR